MTPTTVQDAASIDPFDLEFLENPPMFHAMLRDAAPVVRLEKYGVYAMARYAEVHAALVDWQSFQSAAGVGLSNFRTEKPWRPPSVLLEADPPRHDAPRAVVAPLLTTRRLRDLEEKWRADAATLVAELLERGTAFDAVTDLAEVFPLRVFPDAVGIGTAGRENLLPYGDFAFNAFGPANELVTSASPHMPPVTEWIGRQTLRENLTDDGFGAQIWAAADRGEITPEQAPMIVRSLLTAGVDTTVTGIAAIMHALAHTPGSVARLRRDRHLTRTAFEEAVRLTSPVQTFFRTATRDIRVGDVEIHDGEKILMFLGSANRDPRRWDDPDVFDLDRDPSGHVAFGMGIHQCVGQHIARLEAEAVLTAMARRIRRIDPSGTPVRHHNNTLRGWKSVPIRLTPA